MYSPYDNLWVTGGRSAVGALGLAFTSDLSSTWTRVLGSTFNCRYVYALSYSARLRRWLALGTPNGGTHNMGYSNDGKTWLPITSPFTTSNDAYFSNDQNLWIAGGLGTNTLAYSSDGITWTGLGTTIFSTSCNAVVYSSEKKIWVAGGSGTNSFAYSYDGVNWTGLGTSVLTTVDGLAYSNELNMFSAIGIGSLITNPASAYSYDGINWFTSTNPIFIGSGIRFVVSPYYDGNLQIYTDASNNNIIYNDFSTEISTYILDISNKVGINTNTPTSPLHINGNKFRIRNSLPSPSGGEVGDICWEDTKLWVKTNVGWKYATLA